METRAEIINLEETSEGEALITIKASANADQVEELVGKELTVSMKRYREKRSLGANALLWKIIDNMASIVSIKPMDVYMRLLEDYGQHVYLSVRPEAAKTLEQMFRKAEYMGTSTVCGSRMDQYRCTIGSSTYDVDQMQTLLDGAVYESEQIGGFVPEQKDVAMSLDIWRRRDASNT